ncbi:MAG: hypothetical protein L6Q54_03575 [Leptospiraceae bacterium]|nr:hypothetical protein [Leptospiraceae bacterium]
MEKLFTKLIFLVFLNCIGIDKPIVFEPESLKANKFKIDIHKILGLDGGQSLKPMHLFLFYIGSQNQPVNSDLYFDESKTVSSPYILSNVEDEEVTLDTLTSVAFGDFEPEMRKVQMANLKNMQDYIQSKEFSETVKIIGKPPNYQEGWTLNQIQSSYIDEIKVDVPKANDELLIIYRRMVNFQLFNMLDMYYKVEFDSNTVDEAFLGNCIVELWELRKNIIDEIKRRGL